MNRSPLLDRDLRMSLSLGALLTAALAVAACSSGSSSSTASSAAGSGGASSAASSGTAGSTGSGAGSSTGSTGSNPGPDAGTAPDAGEVDAGPPQIGAVSGTVVDATGSAIAGVTLSNGSATATSAADGTFTLSGVVGDPASAVIDLKASGFLETSFAVPITSGQTSELDPVMMAAGASQPLDATHGGTITGPRGSSLVAGPGSFVDSSGNPVTGQVQVALTPLTPGYPGEITAYPGNLVGVDSSGEVVPLMTHGVLDVTVTQNGQKLQIAPGKTVTVTIPAASVGQLPSGSVLWSYDLANAVWKYEGNATLSGSSYTAQLPHLSFWNIDCGYKTGVVCAHGELRDCQGNPIVNAQLTVVASDNSYSTKVGEGSASVDVAGASFCLTLPPPGGPGDTDADDRCAAGVSAPGWNLTVTARGVNVNVYFPQPPEPSGGEICESLEESGACIELGNVGCAPDGGTISFADAGSCQYSDGGLNLPDGGLMSAVDPFAGTCVENQGLTSFFACSAGAGGCTFDSTMMTGEGPFTFTYANGVKETLTATGSNSAQIQYTGANGMPCGTMNVNPSGTTIILPTGSAFQLGKGLDGSESVICPNGAQVLLSAGQLSSTHQCLTEGNAMSCKAKGAVGTGCNSNLDCGGLEQTTCCYDQQLGNLCLTGQQLCSEYMSMGCASDGDCSSLSTCCPVTGAGFSICQPDCQDSMSVCGLANPCPSNGVCCTPAGGSTTVCLPEGSYCPSQCFSDSDCNGGSCCPAAQTSYQQCLPPGNTCAGSYCTSAVDCMSGQTCCRFNPSVEYGSCYLTTDCPS